MDGPGVPAGGNPALLLLLLDGRSPAGAHAHSGGMEAAVGAGWVRDTGDVARFCALRLRTSGRVAAAFAAAAARLAQAGGSAGQWTDLDAELAARQPSPAARAASRQLGSGLRRLMTAMEPDAAAGLAAAWQQVPRPAPHQPLVLGAAVTIAGGSPRLAAVAAALGLCTAAASAAVRLLGLDPYAVAALLAGLSAEISAIGSEYGDAAWPGGPAGLPALGTPALDLLADVHARSEVRLFAS